MAGLDEMIQRADASIHQVVARVRGFKASYTVVTDQTVVPNLKTVLTVFMETTPTTWEYDKTDGRFVRRTLDIFTISRNELKVAGAFVEPTLKDSFVIFGTTTPVYSVRKVDDLAEASGAYQLTCNAIEEENARG